MNAVAKTVQAEVLAPSPAPAQSHGTMITAALVQAIGLPEQGVERLERLWAMQKEMQDRDAEQEYSAAMSRAQRRMPRIRKDAKNNQTNSHYAKLETILAEITPIYTDEGFSLSFGTFQSELAEHVGIVCDVLHIGGFSRRYTYDAPIDDEGIQGNKNKTTTHGRGSAISYGRRYLTCMIFNLTIGSEDNDGNGSRGQFSQEVLDKVKGFEDRISKADTEDKLQAIGRDIAGANLPGKLQTRVRDVFSAKGNELRQKAKAAKAGAK